MYDIATEITKSQQLSTDKISCDRKSVDCLLMNNNNIIIMTIRTLRVNVYQTVLFKR